MGSITQGSFALPPAILLGVAGCTASEVDLASGTGEGAGSSISAETSMADLIAAAEQEGATFPRDAEVRPYPPYPLPGGTQIVGDSARKCVDVPPASNTQVRSIALRRLQRVTCT